SDHYDIDLTTRFDDFDSLSVSLWIKWSGSGSDYRAVVGNGYFGNGSWEIRFGRETGGTRLSLRVNTATQLSGQTGDLFLPENEWHFVRMDYDGENLYGYLDGQEQFSKPLTGYMKVPTSGDLVRVGRNIQGPAENFSGWIDDLRISTSTSLAVPEPGSLELFVLGLGILEGLRRYRRNSTNFPVTRFAVASVPRLASRTRVVS
ncbi:MAG: LamG-like jellyroll fold domain-containing protein, partial [Myxococcota bacterium]